MTRVIPPPNLRPVITPAGCISGHPVAAAAPAGIPPEHRAADLVPAVTRWGHNHETHHHHASPELAEHCRVAGISLSFARREALLGRKRLLPVLAPADRCDRGGDL